MPATDSVRVDARAEGRRAERHDGEPHEQESSEQKVTRNTETLRHLEDETLQRSGKRQVAPWAKCHAP